MTEAAKVLVIEDDPFLQKVYQSKLKDTNYNCQFALDGKEGWNKIQEFKPKVVLLDLVMPNMDGFEVLAELQKNTELAKATNVLVLTNLSQPEDQEKCLQLGAKEYMVKSDVSIQEILSKVQQYAQ